MIELGPMPRLHVQLHIQGNSLIRVALFRSPSFSVETETSSPLFEQLVVWLRDYAKGKPSRLPFDLPYTGFRGAVIDVLKSIPWGAVFSYQDVAKATGNQRAARAVGNICRSNPFPLLIPCHRIIKKNGEVGRYTPDPEIKKELLYFEGVTLT